MSEVGIVRFAGTWVKYLPSTDCCIAALSARKQLIFVCRVRYHADRTRKKFGALTNFPGSLNIFRRARAVRLILSTMAPIEKLLTQYKTKIRFRYAVEEERAKGNSRDLLVKLMTTRLEDGATNRFTPALDDVQFLDVMLEVFGDAPPEDWEAVWTTSRAEWDGWDISAEATIYFFHRMPDSWKTLAFLAVVDDLVAIWGSVIQPDTREFRRLRSLLPHQFPTSERFFFLEEAVSQTRDFLDSEDGMVRFFEEYANPMTDVPMVLGALFQHFEDRVTPRVLGAAITAYGASTALEMLNFDVPSRFHHKVPLARKGCAFTWDYLTDVPDSEDILRTLARLLDTESSTRWVDYVTNDPPLRRRESYPDRAPSEGRARTVDRIRQMANEQ